MKNTFKNVIQLLDYYHDEKTCRDLLELRRWSGKVTCPHCEHNKVYRTNRGFKCANTECHKKFSVISGTILENTKISLRYWFGAIYLATAHKKGISSHQLGRDLGISQKTAWFLLHRIRHMLKESAPTMFRTTVEADETFVGGKVKNKIASLRKALKNKTSPLIKTAVLGLLERKGEISTTVIGNQVNRETIVPIVHAKLAPGAILVTDSSHMYTPLNKDFSHHVINHEQGEYVRGFVHTNGIENFWSLLKRGIIGIYHQVSPKHLGKYCDEFAYRFNTRKITDVQRFDRVLTHTTGRLTWNTLTAKA